MGRLGFERGFHRINEIVMYRVAQKAFETYWRVRGRQEYDVSRSRRGSEFEIELIF